MRLGINPLYLTKTNGNLLAVANFLYAYITNSSISEPRFSPLAPGTSNFRDTNKYVLSVTGQEDTRKNRYL